VFAVSEIEHRHKAIISIGGIKSFAPAYLGLLLTSFDLRPSRPLRSGNLAASGD
jgi:hypothetical protein